MQGMFDADGCGFGHQNGFAGNHFALIACPCADTAGVGAAFKIFVRSGGIEFFNASFNAHLAFKFRPEKGHGGKGVCRIGAAFTAVVIGKENKAFRIDFF